MSAYEEAVASPYYSGVGVMNSESNYYNNARLMDMCNLEHSWNSSNYCADLKTQDCCHGRIATTATPHGFYRSPSYCPGSSSELDDMDKQFHDGLFSNISSSIAETTTTNGVLTAAPPPIVRVIKKRCTANKKERRRTQSINNAFSCLREKIPNVPADTKLSKIKTLKLAILYIKYLVDLVETVPFADGEQPPDPKKGFRADLKPLHRKNASEKRTVYFSKGELKASQRTSNKGRTGWPQDVWASELLPEQK